MERIKFIELDKLIKADWNYKKDDVKKMEKLIANLKRNGQVENLIVRQVDDKFEVVNGNHRLDALRELNFEKAFCYDVGEIPLREAKRLAVETNETKFETDTIKLAETFGDIMIDYPASELVLTMPYSLDEIENYGKLLEFDWEQYENQEKNQEKPAKEHICPKCGHQYTD